KFISARFIKPLLILFILAITFNTSISDAASDVVTNPNSLHKIEKEDGDDCYYLEETNDFVVVSTDGYIRTYFRPDRGKDYFDKQ
ncbi:MAG: hypothetical protein J5684_00810, partial [Eubacterium sp.]|nr:hypothetical protein [Eubacterium sp.]